jgi:hypothetical protein
VEGRKAVGWWVRTLRSNLAQSDCRGWSDHIEMLPAETDVKR